MCSSPSYFLIFLVQKCYRSDDRKKNNYPMIGSSGYEGLSAEVSFGNKIIHIFSDNVRHVVWAKHMPFFLQKYSNDRTPLRKRKFCVR